VDPDPGRRPRRRRGPWIPVAKLGRVRVYLDPTLPVALALLALIGVGRARAGTAFLALLLLVVFVTVHELGHALTARRLGLRVQGIYLHLFPVTYVEPAEGAKELRVALAGPAASLLLGGILLLVRVLMPTPWPAPSAWSEDPWMLAAGVNLLMGVVNLVPVLPADGGRALRAGLGLRFGRARAGRLVGLLGVILGFVLAALSLALVAMPYAAWLTALGLYVAWVSARAARGR